MQLAHLHPAVELNFQKRGYEVDILFPDTGLIRTLLNFVGDGLIYQLYSNDYTPTLNDALSNYTQANWSGYTPGTVDQGDFVVQEIVEHVGGIEANAIPFFNTSNTSVVVYGYFVTDSTGTILLAAARFDQAPVTIPVGGFWPVTPMIGDYSGLSS